MADKDEKKEKETETDKSARKAAFAGKVLLVSVVIMAGVFLPSTVVFAVCMVPSFVAAIIDRHPQKTAWITVGAMNLAGTLPAWFALWERGHGMKEAVDIVTDPGMLVIAYGGAGVGWFLYHNVTPMVAGLVAMRNEKRLKEIDKRQKELVRKWGENVAKH